MERKIITKKADQINSKGQIQQPSLTRILPTKMVIAFSNHGC